MKFLALSIGLFGVAQATLWFWAPKVVRWQTHNALARYQAAESIDVVMQVFQESVQYTFIEAGVVGTLMLLCSVLVLAHKRSGWNLWLACLFLALVGAAFSGVSNGFSTGLALRFLLLAAFSFATLRAHRANLMTNWFNTEHNI